MPYLRHGFTATGRGRRARPGAPRDRLTLRTRFLRSYLISSPELQAAVSKGLGSEMGLTAGQSGQRLGPNCPWPEVTRKTRAASAPAVNLWLPVGLCASVSPPGQEMGSPCPLCPPHRPQLPYPSQGVIVWLSHLVGCPGDPSRHVLDSQGLVFRGHLTEVSGVKFSFTSGSSSQRTHLTS